MSKKKGREKFATPESAAKLDFEALSLDSVDLMPRTEFMAQAEIAYTVLIVGGKMLTKTPDELAAVLKAADGDEEGKAIFGIIDELISTKEWFSGFAAVLGSIEARVWVAASRLAMAGSVPA